MHLKTNKIKKNNIKETKQIHGISHQNKKIQQLQENKKWNINECTPMTQMGAELQKPYHGSWRGGIKNHSVLVISLSSLSSEATKEVDKRGVESEAKMKDKLKMNVKSSLKGGTKNKRNENKKYAKQVGTTKGAQNELKDSISETYRLKIEER